MRRKNPTRDTEPARILPASPPDDNESEWDEIAESSWESFPASDPPAWAGQGSPRLSRVPAAVRQGAAILPR